MRVKCLSVRLEGLVKISDKAYSAKAFDGSKAIIPASQIFGQDFDISKSDAYWISEWILRQNSIQYSHKKEAWFDSETKRIIPTYTVEKYKPTKINPVESNEISILKSE